MANNGFRWFDQPTRYDEEEDKVIPGRAGFLSRLGSTMQNVARPFGAAYGTNLPAGRDFSDEAEREYEIMKEQLRQKNLEKRAKEELKIEETRRFQTKLDKLKLTAAEAGVDPKLIMGESDPERLHKAIAEQKATMNPAAQKKESQMNAAKTMIKNKSMWNSSLGQMDKVDNPEEMRVRLSQMSITQPWLSPDQPEIAQAIDAAYAKPAKGPGLLGGIGKGMGKIGEGLGRAAMAPFTAPFDMMRRRPKTPRGRWLLQQGLAEDIPEEELLDEIERLEAQ